jgi:hypothetical protein
MRGFTQWRRHLNEVFVKINGKLCYLWRAVDHEGEILETVVTALSVGTPLGRSVGASGNVKPLRLNPCDVALGPRCAVCGHPCGTRENTTLEACRPKNGQRNWNCSAGRSCLFLMQK